MILAFLTKTSLFKRSTVAHWSSGRVVSSTITGITVVSLSKTFYSMLSTGSTPGMQENVPT